MSASISLAHSRPWTRLQNHVSFVTGDATPRTAHTHVVPKEHPSPYPPAPFKRMFTPRQPESAKRRQDDDDGGRFLVLSKTDGAADFDYRLARYGPGIEAVGGAGAWAQAVAVADPFDGCDDKAYTARSTP